MAADFRQVAAALGNDHARRAFAHLALGDDEQAVIDDLGQSRGAKALAALRRAGLVETDAASVRAEVFRELIVAGGIRPRAVGIEQFVIGGRIDRYPVRTDELDALLLWARDRVIPLEITLTEAEVNDRLSSVTSDTALLRRYLVDAGFVLRTRSGSEYRRPRDEDALWGDVPWSAGTWTNDPVEVREANATRRASSDVAADGASLGGDGADAPPSNSGEFGVVRAEVVAAAGSDAWRTTAYGFVHDTEHALLAPFAHGTAVEVSFIADFDAQFDQAGLFVRIDEHNWIKAGVEYADGVPQVGAVVTREVSDWSVAPVPEWAGRRVTVRASWDRDALTIRARVDDEPSRLVRLVPLEPDATASAGPFLCAPTRAGLTVRFTGWQVGEVDAALH